MQTPQRRHRRAVAATQPVAAALLTGAKPEDLQALIKEGTEARNTLVEANTGLVGASGGPVRARQPPLRGLHSGSALLDCLVTDIANQPMDPATRRC